MSISLSAGVRQNLMSLQQTTDLMTMTQNRLATGNKVNSALDDPTAFFTAATMSNRASDLNNILDNVGTAVETLKSADNALDAIIKLVETASANLSQAQNSASTQATTIGTLSIKGVSDLGAAANGIDDADVITINGTAVTIADGDGVDDFLADINAITDVTASITSEGFLKIEANDNGTLIIADTTGTAGAALGLTIGTTAAGSSNTTRANLAIEYDAIRTQIDQLASDSVFNGINLLQSDSLSVIFNEDSTSLMSISGVDFDASGLSISAAVTSFQTDKDLTDAKTELSTALATLRDQASTFGSKMSIVETRQNFTKSLIGTLQNAAGKLTLADTNEEGANMLALQTRQQLSTVSLSMANQADQSVLRLFQ